MRSRKYDKDGQTHFVTELYVETIKFMSPKSQNNEILSDSILDIDSQNIDNHDLLEI
jgi:single-strand DNA-binding protein